MRIFLITRSINPPWNEGVKNLVRGIIEEVKEHQFIVPTKKGFSFGKDNVKEIFISFGKESYEVPLREKLRLWKYLLKEKVDLYHVILTPKLYLPYLIQPLANKRGVKIIQTVTNFIENRGKKIYFGDKIVVLSKHTQQRLQEMHIDSEVIYPGVEIKRAIESRKSQKDFPWTGRSTILYPGDLNQEIINRLLYIIFHLPPWINFLIAIREKTRRERKWKVFLEKITKEKNLKNLFFIGEVEDMIAVISSVDVVIFPVPKITKKLEIPLVLLESLALGKPLILSASPPLKEILIEEAGFVVEEENDFPVKIKLLLGRKELISRFSQNAKKLVAKYFNLSTMAKNYCRVYNSMR